MLRLWAKCKYFISITCSNACFVTGALPAGKQHWDSVEWALTWCHNVESTLDQCWFNVVTPAGRLALTLCFLCSMRLIICPWFAVSKGTVILGKGRFSEMVLYFPELENSSHMRTSGYVCVRAFERCAYMRPYARTHMYARMCIWCMCTCMHVSACVNSRAFMCISQSISQPDSF